MYYGKEDPVGNDWSEAYKSAKFVSNYVHNRNEWGHKVAYVPYVNANDIAGSMGFATDTYVNDSGITKPLFDVAILQPGLFYNGNWTAFDSIVNYVSRYKALNPDSLTQVGIEFEFDMGLVTGRGDVGPWIPADKKIFFNAYLNRIMPLMAQGVPIGIYSGGPNEQGMNNIYKNINVHNWGNNTVYPYGGFDSNSAAYSRIYYRDFGGYGGNLIYDINNYIYRGTWNPALTDFGLIRP
jgi:hypothetical protein